MARAITDANGTVIWEASPEPFGQAAPNEDPDGDGTGFVFDLRLPGQYFDAETGLHFNYFRTYDPATGRYLESDPIGLAGGLNPYLYANANPLRFIDPLGLTQRDIDAAREIAVHSQPDLQFPEQYGSRDLGKTDDGRDVVGLTLPGVGIILDDQYQRVLNNRQACELLNTIIHESIHFTLPMDDPRQDDEHGGYPYSEANQRTTKILCNELRKL